MPEPIPSPAEASNNQPLVRARIVAAGLEILAEGGRDALTTRAIAAAAGVQAPTIYRLFGDKRGLLEAVARHGLERYLQEKQADGPRPDPLDDLRAGWDMNVAFGLAHPGIFSIIADPETGPLSSAVVAGMDILRRKIARIATAGLLRVNEERALGLVRASGVGVVLVLLGVPKANRDLGLSAAAREAVIAAITSTGPAIEATGPAGAAIALRASLGAAPGLTPGERHLLEELLGRLGRSAS